MTAPAEDDKGRFIELDSTTARLYEDWVEAKAAAEQWAERRDELQAILMERLPDHGKGTIDGRHVVTKVPPTTVDRFDSRRFREAMPDLYNDFVVPQYRAGYLRLAGKR